MFKQIKLRHKFKLKETKKYIPSEKSHLYDAEVARLKVKSPNCLRTGAISMSDSVEVVV